LVWGVGKGHKKIPNLIWKYQSFLSGWKADKGKEKCQFVGSKENVNLPGCKASKTLPQSGLIFLAPQFLGLIGF